MKREAGGILPIVAVDRASATPLYRQVYNGYRDAIVDRRLRPGQRLPSTRWLAAELRISRVPVLNAFEQLLAEGYFESRVGSGTFVAASLPDAPPVTATSRALAGRGRRIVSRTPVPRASGNADPWLRGRGPFRVSEPAVDEFPFRAWSGLMARRGRSFGGELVHYGDPMGHRPFREAVASYLRTARAVRCEADQIMTVSGSQQALAISARALLDPQSPVWVEEPGYAGARDALRTAGARVVPVTVDDEGLSVTAGVTRCRRARAVYVTPSHQYPLGVTMSASRRLQLLDWARRAGSWIIEDDYDSEYRYESLPIASLQGMDRDARVIYIGTFSKVLFPALRLGYIVIPPDLVTRFSAIREAMDIFPPTLPQAVLADFINEGHFARHIRKTRQLYRERRGVLVDALRADFGRRLQIMGDQAGIHLVAALSGGPRDVRIAAGAARRGLWVMPLSACYLGEALRHGLVLGYGGTTAEAIPDAVRRLSAVVRSA
jgi:GntR family transcriptional regulator/MocR family aminotransferase